MITFFSFSEFVNFVKLSLINIKYDVKLLSYSIDSLKTIVQNIEMNTSHKTNSPQQCISNIQELKWPITNMTQLDDNEKLLTDPLIKNNEVSFLIVHLIVLLVTLFLGIYIK